MIEPLNSSGGRETGGQQSGGGKSGSPESIGSDGWTASRIDVASRPRPNVLQILANPSAPPRQRIGAARRLMLYGRVDEAARMLRRLLDAPAFRAEAEDLLAVCRDLAPFGVGETFAADAAPGAGYWVKPAGSDTTLVAFTGRAQLVGVSIYFLERLLGRSGFNLVFLFDWRDVHYFEGVAGLGDTIEEAGAGLRRLVAGLGGSRVICLGQSAGGYGALRYAPSLGASGVLAFSPILLESAGARDRLSARLGRPVSAEDAGLARSYADCGPSPPRVSVIHGADNVWDAKAAGTLRDMLGATVTPLPGVAEHGTLQHAVAKGRFFEIVDPILAGFCEPASD